jgi:UDP-N-acetylglucosamine--N-acetylmuramyl-(pentapeptide) pyrophosphoryl-undecaprenol N-acetylglucosamine transferase
MTAPPRTFALFAGGGTGGHVVPALAVADELVARGHAPATIHFVGSDRGIETTMVPDAGFGLTTLPGRGVARRVSVQSLLAIFGIVVGVFRGIGVVRGLRPQVVVAYGSYAAVPGIVGAVLWRVPIIVMARDARGGAADRLGARFAKASAVPFAGSDLPRAVVTGNPVRDEIGAIDLATDAEPARLELGLPADRVVVGVFTGSLGSRTVNTAVRGLVERWSNRSDVAIRHAVGRYQWATYRESFPVLPDGGLVYQAFEYEEHMEWLLAAADVVVTRAGGATVAELAAVGLPAIVVPLPIAPRDHQWFNGQVLVDAGAAVMVRDAEFDTDRLERELEPLVADADRRARMAAGARTVGRPDAAARVADLIERYAA